MIRCDGPMPCRLPSVALRAAFLLCLLISLAVQAEPGDAVDVDAPWGMLGEHVTVLEETGSPLDLPRARSAYAEGRFRPSPGRVLNFGIGARPHWVRIPLHNGHAMPVLRSLLIENSWLDRLDLYLVQDGRMLDHYRLGDRLPAATRRNRHRHPLYEPLLPPGDSILYLRVETPDPMVLPIRFGHPEARLRYDALNAYGYGALYGFALALLLYNLVLFLRIRQARYLAYGIFLFSFIFANASYTGHLVWALWPPHRPVWQGLNPTAIALYATCGILFGLAFLDIRRLLPVLYRGVLALIALVWGVLTVLWLAGEQAWVVAGAIGFAIFYSLAVLPLAVFAWRWGRSEAGYYLLASLAGATGTAVTALGVSNLIPFNEFAFHAVELGVAIDAVLLSFALAEQFRLAQRQRILAERVSRLDPLTSLYNRRAFQELAAPLLANAERQGRPVSLLLLDLDEFKAVNDDYGHREGDQVLRQVARILRQSVPRDAVLARWGGEEFVVLMPNTDAGKATRLAERLRTAVEGLPARRSLGHRSRRITASLGVCSQQGSSLSLDALVRTAEANLHRAKALGRNCVCV